MIYIPANENLCDWLTGTEVEYEAGERYIGATSGLLIVPGADHIGEVQAWNVDTGQRVWTHNYPTSPNWGSMLATAGGLVFSGGTNDRKLHAFDATTGKLLWEFPTNSGILAPPSSFTHRRQAVHRRAVGLGHRLARHAEPAQHAHQGRLPGGARGRRHLGVCGAGLAGS